MEKERKSYGIICARYNKKKEKIEVLLVQKRYTYYYIEFILGHYNRNDVKRLTYLFNNMTVDEKVTILSLDFGMIWYKFCLINPDRSESTYSLTTKERERYNKCKRKFESIFLHNQEYLRKLINMSKSKGYLWEIPKGRKSYPQEKELNAAIREFCEETQVTEQMYELIHDHDQIKLSYYSSNVKYTNLYYLAFANKKRYYNNENDQKVSKSIADDESDIMLNYSTNSQVCEILSIKWMTIDEINITDKSRRFYTLLTPIFKCIQKKYKLPYKTNMKLI